MNNSHEPSVDRLAKRVLDRIEEGHLRPRSRWTFVFQNYTFWTLGALAIIVGAFAFSAGLFEVENAGWQFYTATHTDFLTFFLDSAPFLWLFVLALFLVLGYVNVRRTKRGYRYSLAIIALGAVLTSIALGSGLYAAGFGPEIEEAIGDHPPFYRPILSEEHSRWVSPGQGLLGGSIVSLASSTSAFVLKDFSGTLWTITTSDLRGNDFVVLAHGGTVRVVGVPQTATSSIFHACFVFPWQVFGFVNDELPPPPLFVPASSSETTTSSPRSQLCKGIRPYTQLRALDETSF